MSTAELSRDRRVEFEREILSFLRHCKACRAAATAEVAKQYLADRELRGPGAAREALRWFYREGAKRRPADTNAVTRVRAPRPVDEEGGGERSSRHAQVPPPAAGDLGESPWERALIKASRERGFLWRTEQTYRDWARRFARFIAPRSPYAASGEEVTAFLSALAVEGRASPSAQKQALNALVFLMEEALGRALGEMRFERARARVRLPSVLIRGECCAVFAQLEGVARLMAELAYGSGLRLMELLRLRVHHLDLERGQLRVLGGKGDRVNGCADARVWATA